MFMTFNLFVLQRQMKAQALHILDNHFQQEALVSSYFFSTSFHSSLVGLGEVAGGAKHLEIKRGQTPFALRLLRQIAQIFPWKFTVAGPFIRFRQTRGIC